MSLTLQQVFNNTRQKLGELNPLYWSDAEIILTINQVIQEMCSEAQSLETVEQIPWPALTQEQPLKVWFENVSDVSIYMGQLFQLQPLEDFSDVQVANRTSGIPVAYYTKVGTNVMSPQGTPGNQTPDIVLQPQHRAPNPDEMLTILGLWPMPSQTASVTVWGTRFHKWVQEPQDPVYIPMRFLDVIVAGAVADGKEKESMLDEAQYYEGKYQAGLQKFKEYAIQRRVLKSLPSYGANGGPLLARGSSSVIYVDQNPGLYNQ